GQEVFMNQSTTACAAALMAPHTVSQIWRPVSVLVKNSTRPATRAAIPAMTRPMGFADMAAFHSHCAAATALVQTTMAFWATVEATVVMRWRRTPSVMALMAPRNVVFIAAASATVAWYSWNTFTPAI